MPTYVITSPEGKEYEVDAPEGASQEAALKYFQTNWKPEKQAESKNPLMKYGVNPLNELAGTVVEPAMQMGSGYLGSAVANIAGTAAAASDYLTGNIEGDPEGFKRYIQDKLTYEPRTVGGKFVSQKVLAPIGGVIESGAEALAKPLSFGNEIAESGLKEAALQGVGFLGVKGAPKATSTLREMNMAKATKLTEQKALDEIKNSIRRKGNDIGMIAPASGAVRETLEKVGGVEQHLSLKNREIATQKIAQDVGLKKGAISDADISYRVKELTTDYANVEKALGNGVPIKLDFKGGVSELLEPMKVKFAQDPKSFAALQAPIDLLEQQLKPIVNSSGKIVKQEIAPSIVMAKIKQLRSDARRFDKDTTGDPAKAEMASVNYKLANLYEDLVEKALGNKTALLEKFRNSRKQLAQIHVLDSARLADGLLDLQKLSSIVGKYGADKKMVTGNIKIAADFANTFKDVTKPITREQFSTPSRWELMASGLGIGGVAGSASGGGLLPLVMAAPLAARAITPTLGKHGMLQGAIPNYQLSGARKALPGIFGGAVGEAAFSPYIEEQK